MVFSYVEIGLSKHKTHSMIIFISFPFSPHIMRKEINKKRIIFPAGIGPMFDAAYVILDQY